jgi:hypothetical protein
VLVEPAAHAQRHEDLQVKAKRLLQVAEAHDAHAVRDLLSCSMRLPSIERVGRADR